MKAQEGQQPKTKPGPGLSTCNCGILAFCSRPSCVELTVERDDGTCMVPPPHAQAR
jgi:hypothetical protein